MIGGRDMKRNWVQIFTVAATYIGTVVGAGFATGKEIIEFFTSYGLMGTLAIIVSGLLFVIVGTKMMLFARRIQAYSYQELNVYLFGKNLGRIINFFTLVILLGVTSVMLSGTGSIFKEQLGLPVQVGIFITLVLCFGIMIKGLDGVLGINTLVVPMMLIFSIILFIPAVRNFQVPSLDSISVDQWRLWINPFLYVSFNLAMAQAVLVPLGKEIDDESTLKWGGIWGGIGLTFMLLSCHFALLNYPNANLFEIPMGQVIKSYGLVVHILFVIVIYGEIITTLVGNVFGLSRQFLSVIRFSEKWIIILILTLCYIISLIGFDTLLEVLYPLFGYIGLLLLFKILYQKIPQD